MTTECACYEFRGNYATQLILAKTRSKGCGLDLLNLDGFWRIGFCAEYTTVGTAFGIAGRLIGHVAV